MKNEKQLLHKFINFLIGSLGELNRMARSDFNDGEFWAFIECLEILGEWSGFKEYGINDIEKHFSV